MHILFRPHLLIYHDFALEIRSKFVPDVSSMQPFDLSYTDTYIYTYKYETSTTIKCYYNTENNAAFSIDFEI